MKNPPTPHPERLAELLNKTVTGPYKEAKVKDVSSEEHRSNFEDHLEDRLKLEVAEMKERRAKTLKKAIQHLDDAIQAHDAGINLRPEPPTITREIKKIKVKDLTPEIEWIERISFPKGGSASREMKLTGGPDVHEDLKRTLNHLIAHLILLCEIVDKDSPFYPGWEEIIEAEKNYLSLFGGTLFDFQLTGITIGGEDDYQGATLVGRKTLSTKKVLNLVAPFTFFEDPSGEGYEFEDRLRILVSQVEQEALLYLDGKIAPPSQLDLFDE